MTLNLSSLLAANRDIAAMSTDDALKALNTKMIAHEDHSHYSFRELTNRFGPKVAAQALGGLKIAAQGNPLLDAAYMAVVTTGLDFANPITQDMIDQLQAAGAWDVDVATKLKSVGITMISLIEQTFSIGLEATLEDVAQSFVALNTQDLLDQLTARYATVRDQIKTGSLSDWKAVKSALSA